MRCDHFDDQVVDLALGELPEAQAEALRTHAAGCPRCAARLAEEQATEATLRAALVPPAPAGLAADLKASLQPAPARPVGGWLALAAAVLVAVWATWPRPKAPTLWVLDARGQVASEGALPLGAPVVAQATTVIRHAGALVRLPPGARATATETRLDLHAGTAWVASGAPATVHTAQGAVVVRGVAQITLVRQEDPMDRKALTLAVAGAAGAAALVVAVLVGDADVQANGQAATLTAGQRAAVIEGGAPRRLPAVGDDRVQALEAEVVAMRRARDAERAEVKRLKARLAVVERARAAAEPDLRPTASVRTDLLALIKAEGMGIYQLSADHPLFKELEAMGPEGIKLLGDLLKTGDSQARFAAAALMERLLDPSAVPLLKEAVFSPDNADNLLVQRMAAHALGKIGGPEAVPTLERLMAEGSEWGVRTNAAHYLAEMGHEAGIEWIRDSYASADDAMAKVALLRSMAAVGDPSYLPVLHEVLTTETEYSKRYLAMHGIAKAARQDSLPILQGIADDPDEDQMIVAAAKKAIAEIQGED